MYVYNVCNVFKFIIRPGRCNRVGCPYKHSVTGRESIRKEYRLKKEQFRINYHAANAGDDPFCDKDKAGHKHRAKVFADWIMDHFSIRKLCSG